MSDEQAMAARLTAIDERQKKSELEGLWIGYAETGANVLEDLRFLLAHVASLQREQERLKSLDDLLMQWTDRAEAAEAQRDTAHAALREARRRLIQADDQLALAEIDAALSLTEEGR